MNLNIYCTEVVYIPVTRINKVTQLQGCNISAFDKKLHDLSSVTTCVSLRDGKCVMWTAQFDYFHVSNKCYL